MINRIHQQSITPQIFKFQIFKYTPHIFKNQSIVKQRVITILSTCPAPAGTSAIFRGVSMLYASFLSCRSCLHVLAGWLQTLHSCKATTPLYPPWEKHFPCKQNSCSFPGGGIAIPDCDNPPPHTHLALASLSHDFTVFTDAVVCTSPELGLIMLAVITVSQPPRLQDLCAPSLHSGDC